MDECLQGLEEYQIFKLNTHVTVGSFALVMMAELLMNIWICYVFYHQDKQVRHLLLPQRYKRRNVKNAIDFFCHMLHFVLEILLTLFVILGSRISRPKTAEKDGLESFFNWPVESFLWLSYYVYPRPWSKSWDQLWQEFHSPFQLWEIVGRMIHPLSIQVGLNISLLLNGAKTGIFSTWKWKQVP